ncbi:MAG: hydantoinase/oxoprolinase family protein [Proteobacteria bacterium]|nr:hydantoinase/oxoprolinase family protein [Pseudomonadota bacterium]
MRYILAVDIGGTFTDLVAYDLDSGAVRYAKTPTTYNDFVEGIFTCFSKADVSVRDAALVKHGSTLVINALIQRRGAKTALITTKGFRDTLEIGRGNRPTPFDLRYRRDDALVPRTLRFEVAGRIDGKGRELEPLDIKALDRLGDDFAALGIEAVAISFLNSYATPDHEAAAAKLLRSKLPDVYVTAGTELSREWSEYERTATVCANAYVGPSLTGYLERFEGALADHQFDGALYMMGSNGGVLTAERARHEPVTLVESGPVGGCIGAAAFARALGFDNVIAFDMGGTTAKCALVTQGRFSVENSTYIGGFETGFPIRAAVIDIVEVGAGGGSIAWLDSQRRLHVGPKSAGADPGPACYGRGGAEPTVTDANLVLGRLNGDRFLGGDLGLDVAAARDAIRTKIAEPLGYDDEDGLLRMADGIIAITVMRMASAIRRISVERGLDPRDFALFAYGGGGPLHATALARDLNIPVVVIPPEPGNFSATGMLLADARVDEPRTFLRDLDDRGVRESGDLFDSMKRDAALVLAGESKGDMVFQHDAEMRFKGQKHSIKIDVGGLPSASAIHGVFLEQYRQRYGHADEAAAVEYVGLHLGAEISTPGPDVARLARETGQGPVDPGSRPVRMPDTVQPVDVAVYDRNRLAPGFGAKGPAIIEEYGSTTLIGSDDAFEIGKLGEIGIDCRRTEGTGQG